MSGHGGHDGGAGGYTSAVQVQHNPAAALVGPPLSEGLEDAIEIEIEQGQAIVYVRVNRSIPNSDR